MNEKPCTVAILAGGKGTRLKARTGSLPKPMALLLGKPVLEHLIELCVNQGFRHIALLVHYEHETISDYFGDGARWGASLTYCVEGDARGTAGALGDALQTLADRFLVLYGDTYADVDLRRLWCAHDSKGAQATIFLHPNDHPADSDLVEIDSSGLVRAIHPYPHPEETARRNLVNAALYVFDKDCVASAISTTEKSDIAKDLLPALMAHGHAVRGYISPEYIKDMGTPDRLDKVERDIASGLTARLSARQPRSAVFLDRDGTINVEVGHLKSADELVLQAGAAGAIHALNRAGLLAVGVTNQPVLARGDTDWPGINLIHARLDRLLGEENAYLDRLYLCPHHPDSGFPGEVSALKRDCECRKPKAGLIDQAVADLEISRRDSWMIGDSSADMLAGRRGGLRTILVRTGHAGLDGKHNYRPDYTMPDLAHAVDWILSGHKCMAQQLLKVVNAASSARTVLIGGLARAGKSSAAQILAELYKAIGRKAHIIPLDRWLKRASDRREGDGVLTRYEVDSLNAAILPLVSATSSMSIELYDYDRRARTHRLLGVENVSAKDVLIIEGVPALLVAELVACANATVHVEVDEEARRKRLFLDYRWRGMDESEADETMSAREIDEVPAVRAAARLASHIVNGE